MNQNRAYILGRMLSKAYHLGRSALVDPVPELWNENSIGSRVDTMKTHFEELLEKLGKEYEYLAKEPVTPDLEIKFLDAMEQGFETLMTDQPNYQEEKSAKEDARKAEMEVKEEIVSETKKILDETVDSVLTGKGGAIPKEYRANMAREMKEVFETLVAKRLMDQSPDHSVIWIEENDAIKFVKGVFESMKEEHMV
ncbi:MAG: hypothetical protein ACYDAM_10275 [Leptospirales bacterium]